jgi:protein-disulfide isomerase
MSESKKSGDNNSQNNQLNLILILILGLFVFNVYLFFRIQGLEESSSVQGAQDNADGAQAASPLSVENLKAYAKDLKLNTKKFNKCLDDGEKEQQVKDDLALGQENGVQGTPGFFINGKFLGGAFPYETFKEIIDKEVDGTATGNCTDYSEDLQQYCQGDDPAFNTEPVDIPVDENTPFMGKEDAAVTVVEFSDFECPFCGRGAETVEQVLSEYPDQVKVYFKQFPLSNIHPNAQKAAEASLCAADQNKFKEYHDKLFAVQE